MEPSVERLKSARKDIAEVLAAIEQGEHAGVSSAGQRLAGELSQLEDSAWGPLLASLEDDEELHGMLSRLRTEFSGVRERLDQIFSPFQKIGHRAFFDFSTGGLVVEMRFVKGDSESLEVRQDLEDTLRIGASVIESVADVMRDMDALSVDAKRQCIGQEFEENLKRVAKGVEEIEEIFNSVRDPATPDVDDMP